MMRGRRGVMRRGSMRMISCDLGGWGRGWGEGNEMDLERKGN